MKERNKETNMKKIMTESMIEIIYLILDIKYNLEDLNFWHDDIYKISYSKDNHYYLITLYNETKEKYKTIKITDSDIYNYIIKYDI